MENQIASSMPGPDGAVAFSSASSHHPDTSRPRPMPPPIITTTPAEATAAASPMPVSAPQPEVARALPAKDSITSGTIEQAYVDFIFYCNPEVPSRTDTAVLRETFRTPPKSGGKSFDTFLLYQLIQKLESKELKTWAELALKLGVEPPDQEKGESSQKIQQYAVRLKRWMHSMHVDAFFEYLMGRPHHPYWSEVTADPALSEQGKDGVAPEDDMALRALLPHIRPKRGRKREADGGRSPSQRPRLETPPGQDDAGQQHSYGPWSAHPDGRSSAAPYSAVPLGDSLRPAGLAPPWVVSDVAQTPLSAYPQSAITPSTMTPSGRALFWADEPRSAITPPRPKINKRHGPKVVSSAWKSGSMPSGKTRGRPPINRTPIDAESPWTRDIPPFPAGGTAATTTAANLKTPSSMHLAGPGSVPLVPSLPPPAATAVIPPLRTEALSLASAALPVTSPSVTSKPARPAISLSVPERSGAPVRLATPPPPPPPPANGPTILQPSAISIPPILTATQDNGTTTTTSAIPQPPSQSSHPQVDILRDGINTELNIKGTGLATLGYGTARPTLGLPPDRCADGPAAEEAGPSSTSDRPNIASMPAPRRGFFDSFDDRTNVDALFSHFVLEAMMADWVDAEGNPAESASAEEASAIITTIIESLWRSSTSNESFLINVAALAGGKMLMTTTRLRLSRLERLAEGVLYACSWEYRLGALKGAFSMTQVVSYELYRPPGYGGAKTEEAGSSAREEGAGGATTATAAAGQDVEGAKYWQKKYEELAGILKNKDQQILDLEQGVFTTLKKSRGGG